MLMSDGRRLRPQVVVAAAHHLRRRFVVTTDRAALPHSNSSILVYRSGVQAKRRPSAIGRQVDITGRRVNYSLAHFLIDASVNKHALCRCRATTTAGRTKAARVPGGRRSRRVAPLVPSDIVQFRQRQLARARRGPIDRFGRFARFTVSPLENVRSRLGLGPTRPFRRYSFQPNIRCSALSRRLPSFASKLRRI